MARPAKIWFREQDGWYYTTVNGEQLRLSQDKGEAETLFHEAMLQKRRGEEPQSHVSPSFRKFADLYLDDRRRSGSPKTYSTRKIYLQSFIDHARRKRVC